MMMMICSPFYDNEIHQCRNLLYNVSYRNIRYMNLKIMICGVFYDVSYNVFYDFSYDLLYKNLMKIYNLSCDNAIHQCRNLLYNVSYYVSYYDLRYKNSIKKRICNLSCDNEIDQYKNLLCNVSYYNIHYMNLKMMICNDSYDAFCDVSYDVCLRYKNSMKKMIC